MFRCRCVPNENYGVDVREYESAPFFNNLLMVPPGGGIWDDWWLGKVEYDPVLKRLRGVNPQSSRITRGDLFRVNEMMMPQSDIEARNYIEELAKYDWYALDYYPAGWKYYIEFQGYLR